MKRIRPGRRIAGAWVVGLACAPALAVTTIWDGGPAANTNWDTAANWAGDVVPPIANDVQFASAFTSGTTIQTNGNRTANSLIINTLTGFTIGGGPTDRLTLTSGNLTRNDIAGTEANHQISVIVELGANGTWNIAGSGVLQLNSPIFGLTRNLTKTGSGTLLLNGGPGYSYNATFVNAGVLQINNADLGSNAVTVAGGATLDLGAPSSTFTSPLNLNGTGVNGTAGALRLSGNSGIVSGAISLQSDTTINTQIGSLSITGGIGDGVNTFSLTKTGSGDLNLVNPSSYGGATNINAGTLSVAGGTAVGTGAITVAPGASLRLTTSANLNRTLTLGGAGVGSAGALIGGNGATTFSGPVTLASHTSIGVSSAADQLSITASIGDGGGGFNLTKVGPGTLRLPVANSYSGSTTVSAGVLRVDAPAAIANSSSVTVGGGAALELQSALGNFTTALNLAGHGPGSTGALRSSGGQWSGAVNASTDITIAVPNNSFAITGPLTASGSITKIGPGAISFQNAGNSFANLLINEGTLTLTSSGLPAAASITIAAGAEARFAGSGTINSSLILNGAGGGSGALIAPAGAPTWAGSITLASDSTLSSDASLRISGNISGSGRKLTKTGGGALVLSGSNSHAFNEVSQGTLSIQTSSAMPPSSQTTIADGAALEVRGSIVTPASAALSIRGAGVLERGALRSSAGANTWSGPLTLQGDTSIAVAFGSELALPAAITETTRSSLIKIDEGTLILSANNDHTGGTVINEGTLSINGELPLGSGPVTINAGKLLYTASASTSRNFTLVNGGLQAGAGANLTVNGSRVNGGFLMGPGAFLANNSTVLSGVTAFAGTNIQINDSSRLNAFINGGNLTSASTVSWDGGINLSSGVLTLQSGALTTTGVTNDGVINIQNAATLANSANPLVSGGGSRITINSGGTLDVSTNSLELNGALLVNNGTISGTTNVNFGSVAKGSGVYGAVNVTDGGKFSPGNSPGAVITGSTTWNSGGSYIVEIGDSNHDFWLINGVLDLNASAAHPFTISLASLDGLVFDNTRDYTWPVLHVSGGIIGGESAALSLDLDGFKHALAGHFLLERTATDVVIHYSANPEPSTVVLLLLAAFGGRRRRGQEALEKRREKVQSNS